MRRFVLLAVVVGIQLAAGCSCGRPYLPRLQSGWGCGSGSCGTPVLNRPILDLPIIDRPLLNRPILAPSYSGAAGTPLPTYQPMAGIPQPHGYPLGDAGYEPHGDPVGVNYGGMGGHAVGSGGVPLSGVPHGYSGYPAASGGPVSPAPMPVPMVMPSAMPGGVPHDSALLKMPTIVPPGTTAKRPEELARQTGGTK